ncbi:hypothetical protein EJ04DRAFT_480445 [Polyplosphaeria fusca]|uniref:Uncharacterized protein n=1 Tax=Polyplosphaeria fusca TaxID=682080 RepID=A0A9P4V9B4_9PLEO|nr:hypothetical protein EJ04DRAFT_480445 [Polyplosphaeria fusca]
MAAADANNLVIREEHDQQEPPDLDNSGNGPLQVPGLNDCHLEFQFEQERFAFGANDWKQEPRLTVRELEMLALINALTDKPEWNKKVFDEDIVEKWHEEALQQLLISEKAWEWCLTELRDKARTFEKTGYVAAFDTGSGCIKSDTLVSEELRGALVQAVQPLLDAPDDQKDWHPNSDDQVLNLVHPSLFPLVWDKTRILTRGGTVKRDDILDACGKGEVGWTPSTIDSKGNPHRDVQDATSMRFQWLPCEVEFQGEEGNDVKITSYINNLHPDQNLSLYSVIEKLIGLSIEPWNEVLVKPGMNRTPPRITTYGYDFEPDWPEWAVTDDGSRWWYDVKRDLGEERAEEATRKAEEYLKLPDRPNFEDEDSEDEHDQEWSQKFKDGTWDREKDLYNAIDWKWKRIRQLKHPEPGVSYSFDEWKAGKVDKAVVPPTDYGNGVNEHMNYTVDLANTWRKQGLQVIVKLASIELTPENPERKAGNWHIEGMLNEHIVATSIFYYDVDNTTPSRIDFRQEALLDDMSIAYEQSEHWPLEEIFGVEDSLESGLAVQHLGSLATPQGRLIAFPNTLQHAVEPFRLEDPTRPGHRRFIVMWLVDPHYRIVSTRNVPPQRHDWWVAESWDKARVEERLPAELANAVAREVGEWPMGMGEAKKLRLELMEERTKLMPFVESSFEEYNFCEH